jgi:peptidoglycan hydrolase CwlO-like protein
MTPEELLASRMKIATDLHAQIASLRTEVTALRHEMTSFGESLNALRGEISATLNDIRLRQEERAA